MTIADIITYIGVPLAVLGVLPIIYNTIATLITLANVRRMLRHGRLAGIARGDIINHVIEIELPRYTLAPLHRTQHVKEYWNLCEYPSHIPGGTWTIFNWKTNTIGIKTQRLDYSDQLRQPQAEIEFETLISFLLDLGAVPDATGFRMLRGSGLWVPVGTSLLLSQDGREPVLTIAPLDDSDGLLSFAVRWSSKWGMRDHNSLPPYWVLVNGPSPNELNNKSDNAEDLVLSKDKDDITDTDMRKLSTSKSTNYTIEYPPALRCQVGIIGITAAIPDDPLDPDAQMFESLDVSHLRIEEAYTITKGTWFASAVTAFGTSSQTILWNYKIPTEILAFSKKESIPCGVLVLLDVVEESTTPEWATAYNDEEEAREAQFRRLKDQSRAMMREASLPAAQKSAAIRERQMKDHDDWVEGLKATRRRDAERAEKRVFEAMQSPKWGNKLVAEHNLIWLKKEGHVNENYDLKRAVEVMLWRMIQEPEFAETIGIALDQWKAFVDNGGMRRAEYLELKGKQMMFAFASLILALIEESVTAAHGSLADDLQECIRIWRKVRLG